MTTESEFTAAANGRKDERACILRFLRREQAKSERASDDQSLGMHSRERCGIRASVLETMVGYIERGDHLTAGDE